MSEDTTNLFRDKVKDNLGIVKMDRINSLDKKFNKTLKSRKADKDNGEVNYDLVKLLAKKAAYDIKYGNKERGLKNLNQLKKFVKDPLHNPYSLDEFKKLFSTKDQTKVEKFLRSFLPSDYRNYTKDDFKRAAVAAKDFAVDTVTDPFSVGSIPATAIVNKVGYDIDTYPDRLRSKINSAKDDFKTLMKLVKHADPIELKNIGFSYKSIAAAIGANKAKKLFSAIKEKLRLSEDTKNLLKHKDDLSFNDKVKLSDLDHKYQTALKDRKTDKYLSKNNYYGDKPVRGEAHSLRMDTINDDIKNALIKKAIYDIKYGNESRGLKNLNRLLDLKGKDLSPVDNNAEMFKSAFTNMFSKLGSLDKYNDPKVKHVKIGKIGKVYDSKMKNVKFIDRLKNLFKGKDPHTGLELSESENKLIETAAEVVLSKCKNLSESEQIKICLDLIRAKVKKVK